MCVQHSPSKTMKGYLVCLVCNCNSFCYQKSVVIEHKLSDCCLIPSEQYYGENKLHFDEMMSALFLTNILSWIFL